MLTDGRMLTVRIIILRIPRQLQDGRRLTEHSIILMLMDRRALPLLLMYLHIMEILTGTVSKHQGLITL